MSIDAGNVTKAQRELVFESGAIRSESQSARRTSESSNRSVRYNEAQSTTEHRERQLEEQRRLDAERAAREGINPLTKQPMSIPASKAPKFKAGRGLKDAVNA